MLLIQSSVISEKYTAFSSGDASFVLFSEFLLKDEFFWWESEGVFKLDELFVEKEIGEGAGGKEIKEEEEEEELLWESCEREYVRVYLDSSERWRILNHRKCISDETGWDVGIV